MKPKAFNFYLDYAINIEDLSNEEVGELIRSLLHYANTGEVPSMSKIVKVAFNPMRKQIDEEFKHYEIKCKTNSENVKKRWEKERNSGMPNDTSVYERIQTDTNGYKTIRMQQKEEEKEEEYKKKNIKKKNPFRKVSSYIERESPPKQVGLEYIK